MDGVEKWNFNLMHWSCSVVQLIELIHGVFLKLVIMDKELVNLIID